MLEQVRIVVLLLRLHSMMVQIMGRQLIVQLVSEYKTSYVAV